jgi:serine/threonine protein kinase
MKWQDSWVQDATSRPRRGGQGRVQKVRHARTGQLGALKVLHDKRQNHERRYRLQGEVAALQRMEGAGVPRVLDSNSDRWRDRLTDLYVVTEWIEGPTLGDHVKAGGPVSLDSGLQLADALTTIVV